MPTFVFFKCAAKAAGADFHFNTHVLDILKKPCSVGSLTHQVRGVRCADKTQGRAREYHSPVVVNAAGPHSSQITKLAFKDGGVNDMTLTTRACRQEVAHVRAPISANFEKEVWFEIHIQTYQAPRPECLTKSLLSGLHGR